MSKAKLLVAACAMVLGMSEIEAMEPLHDMKLNAFAKRLMNNIETNYPPEWRATMEEAKAGGFLDELLIHQYMGAPAYPNFLLYALSRHANMFCAFDEGFGCSRRTLGTLMTQTEDNQMNAVELALAHGYNDEVVLNLVGEAMRAGVAAQVLLNRDNKNRTALEIAIDEYRSENFFKQVVTLADQVSGLLPQLIDDALVKKAVTYQSPAANYLTGIKQAIDRKSSSI